MRTVHLKLAAGTNDARWVLCPRPKDLTITDVPEDVTAAQVVVLANNTAINLPARPESVPRLPYARLGRGKLVNMVIGRPPLPPEQRSETPVRTLRLSDEHWAELQARGGVQALRDWLS